MSALDSESTAARGRKTPTTSQGQDGMRDFQSKPSNTFTTPPPPPPPALTTTTTTEFSDQVIMSRPSFETGLTAHGALDIVDNPLLSHNAALDLPQFDLALSSLDQDAASHPDQSPSASLQNLTDRQPSSTEFSSTPLDTRNDLSPDILLSHPPQSNEASSEATTTFDQELFQVDARFGPVMNLSDRSEAEMFSEFCEESLRSYGNMAIGAAQNGPRYHHPFGQPGYHPYVPTDTSHELLSPSLTNSSGIALRDDGHHSMNTMHNRPLGSHLGNHAGVRSTADAFQLQTPVSNPRHSPALTGSSLGDVGAAAAQMSSNLVSPIVRVENYGSGEDQPQDYDQQYHEQRNQSNRPSTHHLSPYAVEGKYEEDQNAWDEGFSNEPSSTILRSNDGRWQPDQKSGLSGLGPAQRSQLNDEEMPTLEEQEQQRLVAEKNADVQDWLVHSEAGSEAGDPEPHKLGARMTITRRRARSANDMDRPQLTIPGVEHGSTEPAFVSAVNVPGPGLFIDEKSDFDESSGNGDSSQPESPPAEVRYSYTGEEPSNISLFANQESDAPPPYLKPWNDPPVDNASGDEDAAAPYQPPTSNAAMMRFKQRAQDIESASLAATLGSRRLSESDIGSIIGATGISKPLGDLPAKAKPSDKRDRSASFLNHILPKRNNSNLLKRKNSQITQRNQSTEPAVPLVRQNSRSSFAPKRMGSWGRPKSPQPGAQSPPRGQMLASSPQPSPSQLGPWSQAKNVIRRTRSRSDVSKKRGLAELMTQHGGPPMPPLASPANEAQNSLPPQTDLGDQGTMYHEAVDDLRSQSPITMDLQVRSDPIIPTYDGFRTHVRQLNPRLVDFLVERVTQEQVRRFKRLQELKVKHLNNVRNSSCASGRFCTSLGGEPETLKPRAGNRDSDTPFVGFIIVANGASEENIDAVSEGTMIAAQFPEGVPLPPVKRLPAEFECPLCFKVKKFFKPSDWTKHVHEDVQPFTCTFPNCTEPKSFKRKADWVRHENERHRQLENWTCNIGDCTHVCYRKDNFVQHLVREHKKPEPRVRGAKGDGPSPNSNWASDQSEDIWAVVEDCRRDTTKQPTQEPCGFCGNICNSWKKLSSHLAKHMEQISMPILPLVEQKNLNADSIVSPIDPSRADRQQSQHRQHQQYQHQHNQQLGNGNHGLYNNYLGAMDTPQMGLVSSASDSLYGSMGITASSQQQFPIPSTTLPSQATTHSYPPPQVSYASRTFGSGDLGDGLMQTYPPVNQPAKLRSTLQHYVDQSLGTDHLVSSGYGLSNVQAVSNNSRNNSNSHLYPSPVHSSTYRDQMVSSPVDTTFDGQFSSGSGYFTQPHGQPQQAQPTSMPSTQGYVQQQPVLPSQAGDRRYDQMASYMSQQPQGSGYGNYQ